LGFYIDDPDHVESTAGILSEIYLNDFINQCKRILKYKIAHSAETKEDKIKAELGKYGFFELPYVNQLSEPNKQSLIELISNNRLPYAIAMFDYLGFLRYLETNYIPVKAKLNIEVSKWFNSDIDGRAVKGNIASLNEKTNENKNRYTAYKHKETVKNDYEKLK
jgi:hypothetical protein